MTLTFDLKIQKISNFELKPMFMQNFKVIGPMVQAAGVVYRLTDRQTNGTVGNIDRLW